MKSTLESKRENAGQSQLALRLAGQLPNGTDVER
jgi:hypothetical protein